MNCLQVNAGCKPYMPPERIDGETKVAYDVRADVWSLGITLVRDSPFIRTLCPRLRFAC